MQPAGNTSYNAGCFQLVNARVTASQVNAIPVGTSNQLFFTATSSQGGSGNTVTVRYYIKYQCANTSTTASAYAAQSSGNQIKYSGNFGAAATQITFPGATNSLSIAKTASASTVLPGSEVVYTVTITNSSSQYDAYIERILDNLPSGVTFVGIEPGSDVTAGNSSQVPQPGATGTLAFIGQPFVLDSSGNVSGSYLVPRGGSIRLIYRVTMPSVEGTYSNSVTAHLGSTSIGPASATVYVAVPEISGKVYEDIPGTAQPSGFVPHPGATVRLYQDSNNNGQIDASDTFVAVTTTALDGGYTFSLSAYGTYLVAVDSRSVSPSAGFNSGYGQGDVWVEQTYGDDPTTPALDLGPRYGGRAPGASDGFNATDTAPSANTGAKHLARVAVSGGEVTGVDFAFSFNVVTNLRGGGTEDDDTSANRTVQGSLRQFLQNANAIAGANAMRFVPASPYTPNTSGSGGSWWTLSVTNPLPFVQDASTTLDGTTYDALNPLSVRDTSPGSLGTGGTVGVDALPLPQTPRPELALNFSNQTNASGTAGIRVEAQNTTIRRLSLYGQRGFSTGGQAAIFITSTGQATLEELVVGALPDGSDPASVGAQQNRRYGVRLEGQATVRRSYFAYNGYAILLNGPSAQGSLIEGNEFAYNGPNSTSTEGAPDGDSVAFWNSGSAWSTQTVFRGNLVRDVREVSGGTAGTDPGKGLELWYSGTRNVLIENNTILRARTAGIGIHAGARDNTIRKNLIQDTLGYAGQGGAGVHLSNTGGTPLRNRITQNHFGGNRGVAIDLDAGTWTLGDGVTPNDGNCNNTSQPNLGLDFPVITLAQVVGGGLQVQGTACPGVTVEVYKALAGSGDTLGGLGYGEGVLYLGSGTANASGAFSFTVSLAGLASGDYVSAIAIDANGNTSEFSANVQVVFGYAISGLVYHDREPNGMRNAEDWSDGAMVYVKLVQGTTVLAVQMVSAGSGAYSFSGVAPGTYTLVLDDGIHPADTTPTPPSGWLFINPAGGSRTVTVSSTNVLGQDFGLFHGFRVEGRVFYDDGESGGNANNALQDGSERGVGSVTITATSDYPVRTATTDGSGFYQLYIPASWDSVVLSHPVRPATGHNNGSLASQVASWADATSPASSGAVISLGSAGTLAGATYVRNFGVVRPSLLSPDQAGQATSPGVITYAHQYKPGTLGNATLSLAPTQFSYQLRRDVNCDDDFDDPGEGFQGLPLSFSVNASWPRESDGSLRGCALEVRVIVPAGLSAGQVDLAPFSLNLAWASNPAVVEVRSLTDTTTVIRGGELRLTKQARNHTQNTSFASSAQGRPGEVLEYRIAYQNIGSQPIFNVILFDPVPFFTTLVQNAYGTSGEVELVCPDGTVVRPDLGTTSNISLNLASLCTLSTAPLPGGGSAPALLPGQGGFFVYRVQVN
ncbi:right-handed parallel beta-helix repeat-containing protein [Meiothermus cerbereus]|uniref:right-handed parallel beta-helix repeat-containing protein n=1 Tax=Meiothermus cerbereus TaxID=65552 RepID=UPI003EEC8BF6